MNILIAGHAKTGTTGLLHLIASSSGQPRKIIFEPRECPPEAKQAHGNFIAKVIIRADVNLASFSHFDRKVVIIRDPRDRFISSLLYSQFHDSYLLDEGRVRAVRECLEEKERRPSAISIRGILEVMGAASDKPDAASVYLKGFEGSLKRFDAYIASIADHLLYKYEDFVSGNYAALEGYLGCEMTGKAEVPAALGRVVRTKSYGDWRNWFTEEDVQEYRPMLMPGIEKYGYDPDDWALNVAPSIEREHCSGYFMRLVEEQRRKKPNTAKITVPAKTMSASGTKMPNGKVVRVEPEVVAGWAIGADPEQPIRVALLVNGVEVAQIVADKPRPELKERGLHPTGRCGFAFRFGSARRLQIGDQVRVKPVSGDWGTDFGGDMSMVCCADGESSIERKYGQDVRSKSLNHMSLDNDGICLLNLNLTPPSPGTYVVLGAPRGGTSMLSGALHISGVPMGETLTAATYEDTALIRAISTHNIDHVKALIKRREQQHLQWGWKQPKDFEYFFREVMPLLACPRLLVVFRDLMAVGNRNRISAGSDLFQSMRDTSGAYSAIIAGLAVVQCPIMLLSYEKALLRPAVVVDALLEFTGVAAADKSAITSFIAPSPAEYLKSSYLGIGRVDSIRQDRVVGWASWRDKRSPIVECYINGKFVSESKADRRREDVHDKGLHGTGNCGFSFQLNGPLLICSGDMVSVRIKGSGKDLMGSRVYKGESDSGENPGKFT